MCHVYVMKYQTKTSHLTTQVQSIQFGARHVQIRGRVRGTRLTSIHCTGSELPPGVGHVKVIKYGHKHAYADVSRRRASQSIASDNLRVPGSMPHKPNSGEIDLCAGPTPSCDRPWSLPNTVLVQVDNRMGPGVSMELSQSTSNIPVTSVIRVHHLVDFSLVISVTDKADADLIVIS
ncbi:hypothetical protein PoB_004074400 [Plakobranchus ocellatus]|uniref:Uncharacterized protein n=1 Tax=Plakobranchus ocellatus TaxID=259542 RepID=A0AAV4B2H3_9GAST|nr:hypothetical protein PoB_004074400 [Plakobranchus ocellatus]